ncbi:O-antigen ligase family protein [Leptospira sp. GIMC2001]|uniref:O-antigen ligase family protein n=1 Tax=Leptospira sp. GIMC2001 TaxID=1513297 RepID=UPI00234BFB7B|nr:O-antigen ligase family protein [Leptospira sp. GIMC2001]WCL50576.1 O-antigen ligase family protein [Leptospira sp. GIMC2001]
MISRKFFLFFLCSSIVTSAISVSLGQGFLMLAVISFLLQRQLPDRPRNIFLIASLFWSAQILILLFNYANSGFEFMELKRGWNSETKDVFLFFGFLCFTILKKEELPLIKKSFLIFTIVLVSTGFISIFSDYRLGWLISSLYRDMKSWGFQHNYSRIGSLSINLPIGLMNTHLTYGGLLLLVYPWIFFRFLYSIVSKEVTKIRLLWFGFILIATIVFLLNNARSSMIGAGFGLFVGTIIWIQRKLPRPNRLWIPVLCLIIVIAGSFVSWKVSEPFRRVVAPLLGSEKHTDSGRNFIWDSTFQLIQANPWFGVGPGHYGSEIEIARKERSETFPELVYFYEVTQRGHAHNDYFHIAAIYGIPVLILYFLLVYFIANSVFISKLEFPDIGWTFGIVGFFLAGLLQCYFQDDEVVIFFWFIVGYLYQSNRLETNESSQ